MFVKRKIKSSKSGLKEQNNFDKAEREFEYLTREKEEAVKREGAWDYNAFFGQPGDDEWVREIAAKNLPDYLEHYNDLTFGVPNVGVIIKHLKKFDRPNYSILPAAHGYWAEALIKIRKNEWGGSRKRWDWFTALGLSEASLPSFPGIRYRKCGWSNKGAAETVLMIDAYQAVRKIGQNEQVLRRPCALFGRGKRLAGEEAAGIVGQGRAGRLVMASDGRDHIIISSVAKNLFRFLDESAKSTEIMVGMSFQNRGATVFVNNLIADLVPGLTRRLNFKEEPDHYILPKLDTVTDVFSRTYEEKFRYFVLDLSRQDSSVSSELIDAFFDWARQSWYVIGNEKKKKFGRYMRWIRDYHVETRVALPDGQVWRKHHGNVSGSPLTTLINSYTALIAARTVFGAILGQNSQDKIVVRVYGDNILVCVPKEDDCSWGLADVVEMWKIIFEQQINPDESYECENLIHKIGHKHTDSMSFLSRHVMQGGAVWRPMQDTVASMICPESRAMSSRARYARACGLLVDNPFNVEAGLFLNEILNLLEDEGVFTGELPHREEVKFTHKLMNFKEVDGVNLWGSRLSIAACQFLYTFTSHERTQLRMKPHQVWDALDAWVDRMFEWR
nr:MAG: RNA-dependent RNA polymerase [Partitiviridae sp.]